MQVSESLNFFLLVHKKSNLNSISHALVEQKINRKIFMSDNGSALKKSSQSSQRMLHFFKHPGMIVNLGSLNFRHVDLPVCIFLILFFLVLCFLFFLHSDERCSLS